VRLKTLKAFFLIAVPVFAGSDCDGSFTLDATHTTIQFNNQTRACVNWQVSYFSSGFSAVSVQFESAPNGANSSVPGTWVAFAGTVISGSNPATAATQNTSVFSGSFPWVRVRLVSSTGTGQISGRILGAQLTSATAFPNVFSAISANAVFGIFTPPVSSTFSWVNQGAATVAALNDGFTISIATGASADNISKRCVTLPAAPWTVIAAMVPILNISSTSTRAGLLLQQTGGGVVSEWYDWAYYFPGWRQVNQCTTAAFSSCVSLATDPQVNSGPVIWERVTDNGVQRAWNTSPDGINWVGINRNGLITGANYANITPTQACGAFVQNDNNFAASVKYVSWRVCSGSSGVC
jgi:hypothetical protein